MPSATASWPSHSYRYPCNPACSSAGACRDYRTSTGQRSTILPRGMSVPAKTPRPSRAERAAYSGARSRCRWASEAVSPKVRTRYPVSRVANAPASVCSLPGLEQPLELELAALDAAVEQPVALEQLVVERTAGDVRL